MKTRAASTARVSGSRVVLMMIAFAVHEAVFVCPSAAAERETITSIKPLYYAHVGMDESKLRPAAAYEFEEFMAPVVWEKLGLQIFKVWYVEAGSRLQNDPIICWRGKVMPFVGVGVGRLLSGVVLDDALYYSRTYGSGILSCHVGRLRMKDGVPERHESRRITKAEMMVERSNNRVRVLIRAFPHPEAKWDQVGWIDLQEAQRLKIVNNSGREVQP